MRVGGTVVTCYGRPFFFSFVPHTTLAGHLPPACASAREPIACPAPPITDAINGHLLADDEQRPGYDEGDGRKKKRVIV